jgi:hypothetical protein
VQRGRAGSIFERSIDGVEGGDVPADVEERPRVSLQQLGLVGVEGDELRGRLDELLRVGEDLGMDRARS